MPQQNSITSSPRATSPPRRRAPSRARPSAARRARRDARRRAAGSGRTARRDARARASARPGRPLRRPDGKVDLLDGGEIDRSGLNACRGVVDGADTAGCALVALAADPVVDRFHGRRCLDHSVIVCLLESSAERTRAGACTRACSSSPKSQASGCRREPCATVFTGAGYSLVTYGRSAWVQRIRLARDASRRAVEEVRALLRDRGLAEATWWIGERSTPASLTERLDQLGLEPDDPPELTTLTIGGRPGGRADRRGAARRDARGVPARPRDRLGGFDIPAGSARSAALRRARPGR